MDKVRPALDGATTRVTRFAMIRAAQRRRGAHRKANITPGRNRDRRLVDGGWRAVRHREFDVFGLKRGSAGRTPGGCVGLADALGNRPPCSADATSGARRRRWRTQSIDPRTSLLAE